MIEVSFAAFALIVIVINAILKAFIKLFWKD